LHSRSVVIKLKGHRPPINGTPDLVRAPTLHKGSWTGPQFHTLATDNNS